KKCTSSLTCERSQGPDSSKRGRPVASRKPPNPAWQKDRVDSRLQYLRKGEPGAEVCLREKAPAQRRAGRVEALFGLREIRPEGRIVFDRWGPQHLRLRPLPGARVFCLSLRMSTLQSRDMQSGRRCLRRFASLSHVSQ